MEDGDNYYDEEQSYWNGNIFTPGYDYPAGNIDFEDNVIISEGYIHGDISIGSNTQIRGTQIYGRIIIKGSSNKIENITSNTIEENIKSTNNLFENSSFGKVIIKGTKSKIQNCHVSEELKFENAVNSTAENCSIGGKGIIVDSCSKCSLTRITSTGGSNGVYITNSTECYCTNSNFSNNRNAGRIFNSNNCRIEKSVIKNCTNSLIIDENCNNCTFASNTIQNCSSYGIQIYNSTKCEAFSNTIKNNKSYGIYIKNNTNATIASNEIRGHSLGGIYSLENTGTSSASNEIINNGKYGIKINKDENFSSCEDTINGSSEYGVCITKSDNCSVGDIISNTKIGVYYHKGEKGSVNNCRISDCSISGVYFNNLSESSITNSYIHDLRHKSFSKGKKGEYKIAAISQDFFSDEILPEDKCTIAIIDLNGDSNFINNNRIENNIVGILVENSDNGEILCNYIIGNKIGVIYNKSKSNSITANTILHNTQIGILFHSNLKINPKLCMSNVIDSNIIENAYIFTDDEKCYIPEELIPNDTYYIVPIDSIYNKPYIATGKKTLITDAYFGITKAIQKNDTIDIAFYNKLGSDNGFLPIRFKKQYIKSLIFADDFVNTLPYYNIFFFDDTKQNLVIDNYTNVKKIYVTENLDALIREIKKDNLKRYEFLLSQSSLMTDEAKELRKSSKTSHDKKLMKKIQSYLDENNLSDKYIKDSIINRTNIENKTTNDSKFIITNLNGTIG